ncbi:hypothetical protein GGF43_003852, partial [Coemansia sp. RSA 2618]
YVQCASSSSSTSNLLRRGLSASRRTDAAADPLASAVPSLVTAGDLVRSLANSPLLTPDMSLSDARESSDLRQTSALHMRAHGPSALSRQLSRETCDSSDSSARDSDDDAFSLGSYPEQLLHELHTESSGGDSEDRLRPAQRLMLRRELRGHEDSDHGELLDLEHHYDEGAAAMQRGIPTCPSGCGCNCLYESYKLIIR